MAKPLYKLSAVLEGHTGDVRAVATFADGTIVSASRDKTACVWKPSGDGREYVLNTALKGHTSFVTSVCVIDPSERNPKGVVITGSNDHTINIYTPDEVLPVNSIKGHQNTVCKLNRSKEDGAFLSSSWDVTAKLWNLNDLSKPQVTLVGHTAAVWTVADLPNGLIITGSADKLAIVWTRNGTIQHKLSGHTDCIRDIVTINDDHFLTCANDATVRHWDTILGVCLESYCGHENYIYSIAATPNGASVFTSGEDRTIRIWYNAEINQTITLPTQSVWCINCLPNGDIVAGSSDGVLRTFTTSPERFADLQALEKFDKEVANTQLNAQQELGGMKIKDLPDAKALLEPGQREGQTKIINDGDAVLAYSWSQNRQRWVKIGDVMGASGGSPATSGKQLYNGIEYDYVFSVDIQDGVPPLKLPYNNGQDPWHVAQKFLYDNDLSQLFLDQIANFIVTNSQPVPVLNATAQYADPFTGGSRYIPETRTPNCSAQQESARGPILSSTDTSGGSSYIPHTSYLKLEQANLPAILDKLRDLNSKQTEAYQVPGDKLEALTRLAEGHAVNEALISEAVDTLRKLLEWSNETVFPVLDVARLAVLCKEVNGKLCTEELFPIIRRHIKTDGSPSNQMLTFRLLANMFSHEGGEKLCLNHRDEILKSLTELDSLGSKHNQVAISTYVLNVVVALNKDNDMAGKTQALHVIFYMLPRISESEAVFRSLVGLGTLLSTTADPAKRTEFIEAVRQSEATLNVLQTMSESTVSTNATNKLINCSKQIVDLIV